MHGRLVHSVASWAASNPLLVLAIVGVLLLLTIASASASRGPIQRDEQRLFTAEQKRIIHARAQYRCEHKPVLWRRCTAPGDQADHIYPHAKGGPTTLANGQSLCGPHNRRKSDHIPTPLYRRRLERRRRHYFPPDQPVHVWRPGQRPQ